MFVAFVPGINDNILEMGSKIGGRSNSDCNVRVRYFHYTSAEKTKASMFTTAGLNSLVISGTIIRQVHLAIIHLREK